MFTMSSDEYWQFQEKHEHQQKALSLELEKSERDKREQEAINSQRNYEQSKLSLSQCEQKATYSEQKYQVCNILKLHIKTKLIGIGRPASAMQRSPKRVRFEIQWMCFTKNR